MRYVILLFFEREFVAWRLILLQVMRATGLGVVVEVGPGSIFNVGDRVTGSWGVFPAFPYYISLL